MVYMSSKGKNVLLLVAVAFLLFALVDGLPYGYFFLLRFVVCAVSVGVAVFSYKTERVWAVWLFGFVAVLFNPLVPVYLTREIWVVIDVIVAAFFAASAFLLKPKGK